MKRSNINMIQPKHAFRKFCAHCHGKTLAERLPSKRNDDAKRPAKCNVRKAKLVKDSHNITHVEPRLAVKPNSKPTKPGHHGAYGATRKGPPLQLWSGACNSTQK